MMPLRDALTAKGATFSTGHRAVAFILDEDGAACGMRFYAGSGASVLDVRARRIVVATGGFASSQPLVHEHTPVMSAWGATPSPPWARVSSCARFWAASW